MMKRLRLLIDTAVVLDATTLPALLSLPLDELRQQTFDLGQQRLVFQGALAYFRNQNNVVVFLTDLMELHFMLKESASPQCIMHCLIIASTAESASFPAIIRFLITSGDL